MYIHSPGEAKSTHTVQGHPGVAPRNRMNSQGGRLYGIKWVKCCFPQGKVVDMIGLFE